MKRENQDKTLCSRHGLAVKAAGSLAILGLGCVLLDPAGLVAWCFGGGPAGAVRTGTPAYAPAPVGSGCTKAGGFPETVRWEMDGARIQSRREIFHGSLAAACRQAENQMTARGYRRLKTAAPGGKRTKMLLFLRGEEAAGVEITPTRNGFLLSAVEIGKSTGKPVMPPELRGLQVGKVVSAIHRGGRFPLALTASPLGTRALVERLRTRMRRSGWKETGSMLEQAVKPPAGVRRLRADKGPLHCEIMISSGMEVQPGMNIVTYQLTHL